MWVGEVNENFAKNPSEIKVCPDTVDGGAQYFYLANIIM